ncbi:membrane protein [Hafnia alvei]|uniref:multiple stress resistance protein BhsA n=1 Tax=Hafnia alvei TaxID=569 RepID=UPI0005830A04|nr:DUF1471 domain-containing protein [Hafnia alvei]KID06657.1 membrane protein [Hafnia alvei]
MKIIKNLAVVFALSASAFAATAADLSSQPTSDMQKMGVVSVSGATNLDGLEARVAAKAEQAGASSYRIISTSGNNKMHATAELYK